MLQRGLGEREWKKYRANEATQRQRDRLDGKEKRLKRDCVCHYWPLPLLVLANFVLTDFFLHICKLSLTFLMKTWDMHLKKIMSLLKVKMHNNHGVSPLLNKNPL